ncbi:ESF2/ABP1 family protein, partial [Lecanoromycetidae sp. Uapishka_2]
MPLRKLNEFLDNVGSEDEDAVGNDTEAAVDSRTAGVVSRRSKRQKLTSGTSNSGEDSDQSDEEAHSTHATTVASREATKPNQTISADSLNIPEASSPHENSQKHKAPPSIKSSGRKPGVIYLSRIPPFMKPSTVRTLLSKYGTITKLFLTPEPPSIYLARRKHGGNKKHSFIDGWVEFSRKKDAKV